MNVNNLSLDSNIKMTSLDSICSGENPVFADKNSIKYEGVLRSYTKLSDNLYHLPDNHTAYIKDGYLYIDGAKSAALSQGLQVHNKIYIPEDAQTAVDSNGDVYYINENALYKNGEYVKAATAISVDAQYYAADKSVYDIAGSQIFTANHEINNIAYNDYYIVAGYDVQDSSQCRWTAYKLSDSTVETGSYLGLACNVKGTIAITGQPYYKSLTSTVLSNGVIRWTIDTTSRDTAIANNQTYSNKLSASAPSTPSDLASSSSSYNYTGRAVSYADTTVIYAISITDSITYNECSFDDGIQILDLGLSPGIYWTDEITDFQNIFPYMYSFTNVATNRGKIYDYGKGWTAFYRGNVVYSANKSVTVNKTLGYACVGLKQSYLCKWTPDGLVDNKLDCQVATYLENTTSSVTTLVDEEENIYFVSQGAVTDKDNIRWYAATAEYRDDKAWQSFYHIVGGTNTGDYGLVSAIPFEIEYTDNIKAGYYSNIAAAISYGNVLINTPSTDGVSSLAYNDNYILIDGTVYTFTDEINIYKLANNLYTTNAIQNNNLICIDSDKTQLQNAYIPYINSFEWDDSFLSQSLFSPTTYTNDVWQEGCAYNANVDDKYLSASFILPAIEIPLYISSTNLESFDKLVFDNNNPILKPAVNDSFKYDVYYTHTLRSTDVTYKYTLQNNTESYDNDKADFSWISTSTLIIYPVGLSSIYYIKNYNTQYSTLTNIGEYSSQLYSNNNKTMAVINSVDQIYSDSAVFTIYTTDYYFDGTSIYASGGVNTNTADSFICFAIGLKFLGSSGIEAYFYSNSDKSIYIFSGSTTLSKWITISAIDEISETCFNPSEQLLYLYCKINDSYKLVALSSETSAMWDAGENMTMNLTDTGLYLWDGESTISYSPYKYDRIPVKLATSWIGSTDKLYNFGYMDFYLVNTDGKAKTITVAAETLYDNTVKPNQMTVHISPSDWKSDMYRIRVSPSANTGNAVRYSIKSDDDIAIQAINFAIDQASAIDGVRR